jgi:copper chaperone CopZ
MIEETFNVEGMNCAHCKAAVEKELNRLSGVENSSADFGGGPSRYATTRAASRSAISRTL